MHIIVSDHHHDVSISPRGTILHQHKHKSCAFLTALFMPHSTLRLMCVRGWLSFCMTEIRSQSATFKFDLFFTVLFPAQKLTLHPFRLAGAPIRSYISNRFPVTSRSIVACWYALRWNGSGSNLPTHPYNQLRRFISNIDTFLHKCFAKMEYWYMYAGDLHLSYVPLSRYRHNRLGQ